MIILKQSGFKSFLIYVLSFIFLTLFIYLGIPFFFDYKNNKSDLEKEILNSFGLHLNFTGKAKYNIFPSLRLNLEDVEILGFSKGSKNIGNINKLVLNIPFKKLVSLKKMDFNSASLIGATLNIEVSKIGDFNNYLNNVVNEKPIEFKESKINLLNKGDLLSSIDLQKLKISGKALSKKVNLKGRIFNTKLKINYQNKGVNNNSIKTISSSLPEIGLNLKLNINTDKNNNNIYGKVSVTFLNNKFYFDYTKNNKRIINITSSRLTNNYFQGHLSGDLIFFPFSTFNLKLDINTLKFQNILSSKQLKNNNLSKLIPINNKINGEINIEIDKITSSSNIINSGNINLEFRNGILLVKEIKLNMDKIGNIKIDGQIFQQKNKKKFNYNAKINIDNPSTFYSRLLILKKYRKDIIPINILGSIDLQSYEIKLEKIYLNTELVQIELGKNEILALEEKINQIFLQHTLDNVLKYSNLRKIIQSFFVLN